jgi:hypothetical protein
MRYCIMIQRVDRGPPAVLPPRLGCQVGPRGEHVQAFALVIHGLGATVIGRGTPGNGSGEPAMNGGKPARRWLGAASG